MNLNLTFFFQFLSFAILIGFTMKFIWPPLVNAIDERRRQIAAGLAAAERSEKELAQTHEKVNEVLREARARANEIIEQAHARANQIIDQAKAEAITEADRQVAAAEAEIQAAANRAREELRRQLADLVVSGAEKVIAREIDRGTHRALLNELATEF